MMMIIIIYLICDGFCPFLFIIFKTLTKSECVCVCVCAHAHAHVLVLVHVYLRVVDTVVLGAL